MCDDVPADIDYIKSMVEKWAKARDISVQIETFPSAESFLFRYAEDKDFDVLLLDIEMAAMDGVTMAKKVRRENETVQIVFITGYSDYIAEGYEVEALHYLMKPVHEEKLFQVLDRAMEKLEKKAMSKSDQIEKYEFWGLVIFVGIPLPGTGAWTGALIAALLGIRFRKAFPAIVLGVCLAAFIMTVLSYGFLGFLFG